MAKIHIRTSEEIRIQGMYCIEIQREISNITEDGPYTDTLSLAVGTDFDKAVETFRLICQLNLIPIVNDDVHAVNGLVYIRLRVRFHDQDAVLSRKTPSGVGDW